MGGRVTQVEIEGWRRRVASTRAGPARDEATARLADARRQLATLYEPGGAWFAANEADPAVIAEAMTIVAAAKAP